MGQRLPASPRIEPLSMEAALSAAETVGVPKQIAELNVFRTLLHHPRLAQVINDMLGMLLFEGNKLDARLRELIIMRIGWVTDCDYEWTQHWRVAQMFEIPKEHLLAVRDWQNTDCLSAADRAVLAATDDTLRDGAISPETWAECARHLTTHEEMLELNGAIGAWRLISQFARSAALDLEEGVASWPPDDVRPNVTL